MPGCFLKNRSEVIVSGADVDGQMGLVKLNLLTGQNTSVAYGPFKGAITMMAELSPDGRKLATMQAFGGKMGELQIRTIELQSGESELLGKPGNIGAPFSWLPGGEGLVLNQNHIYPFREGPSPAAYGVRIRKGGWQACGASERVYGDAGLEVSEGRCELADVGGGLLKVNERTREIGIRLAIGAQRRDVFGMMLKRGMRWVAVGGLIGLIGACALTRVLRGLLYEVSPTDPFTFVAVALLIACVALLTCYLPARRAAKVDPMKALRYE